MSEQSDRHRQRLERIARRALSDRGLEPDFPRAALEQLSRLGGPARPTGDDVRDLRQLGWCSIDNDDSRDLDQLSVALEPGAAGWTVLVAVADVDALVPDGSAIDGHARENTTSIYLPGRNYPMLPERLSTDWTSLNPDEDRAAVVVQMVVGADGAVGAASLSRALVRNRAKLAYPSLGAWLEGRGPMPEAIARVPGLEQNLRQQDRAAGALREARHERGALDLETIELQARFDGDDLSDLGEDERNRAKGLIEDFMIAANGATSRFLAEQGFPSLRRVVREPERWSRIADLAREHGSRLPERPDSRALEAFLRRARASDPLRFPDLSLSVIKLLGRGEYVVEVPGRKAEGHFGLAVRDYTHSTAPNRRYPDLITQRLVKAALAGDRPPYEADQLARLAAHCTEREDAVAKAERLVRKAAAAMLLERRIGERFDAIVTGAAPKGTWVRLLHPPVEGRLERGQAGLDVGDRVQVRLVHTDAEQGFIDFHRA